MPADIFSLLSFAVKSGASDLHLSAGSPPIVRVHGSIQRTKMDALSKDELHTLIYDVMDDEQRKNFEKDWELDFSRQIKGIGRFRINVYRDLLGEAAVFRVIPQSIRTIQELGLPQIIQSITKQEKGLILVTGPTGSGKSTTLAAMLDYINTHMQRHIITIEDPIENVFKSKLSLVNQREVGTHTTSFSTALRSALREDPDVIVVGEMRDLETTSLAITAAETGHLVFGTLHTMSASKTIDRVIDQFPPDRQSQIRTMLSESLTAIISQNLLPTAEGKGRVAAFEIMLGTSGIRNLIRENKTYQILSAIQTGGAVGMTTMDMSLIRLGKAKLISNDAALEHANDQVYVRKGLGGA